MARYRDKEKFTPLEVTQRGNESVDRMIKRFSKMVRDDGILQEFTDRRQHTKKSTKRRRKREQAKWTARNGTRN